MLLLLLLLLLLYYLQLIIAEPSWSGIATQDYSLEIIKSGVSLDALKLTKSFLVFGRLPECDVPMEHPSLSRYHAILQYCAIPSEKHPVSKTRMRKLGLIDNVPDHGSGIPVLS